MRTRFLNTDHFSTPSSKVYETLGFLNLPVPRNFSAPVVSDHVEEFLRSFSPIDFFLPIENLPTEPGLSNFLSAVIPDGISVDYEVFKTDRSFSEEINLLVSGDSDLMEKKDGDGMEEKATFEIIEFETPELDPEMEERLSSKREDLLCFSEVPEIENELVKFEESDVVLKNSNDIQQKIYSVDLISSDYFTENNTSVTEDECFRKNRTGSRDASFPLLEVDEVNLSVLPSFSMADNVVTVLETIGLQDTNSESFLDSKELLGSKDYDVLDIISMDCHLNKSGEADMVAEPAFSEVDIVTILEISNFGEQGKVGVGYDFPTVSVTFEEFQILDVEITDVFDVFIGLQNAIEPETCSGMFSKEMKFKNFDELVVSSELAFADDAFKSLPTPLLYDHELIKSLDLIYEKFLSEMKLQSFPASNDIYLSWNLLEEGKHNHEGSFCDYLFEEMVKCNADYKLESLEGDKWVYEFVFSEDALLEPLVERCTEAVLGIPTLDENPPVNNSHGLLDNLSPETGAEGDNAKKAMLLFKSMSAFDDLTFFMDPHKAAAEENLESRGEAATTANHNSRDSCLSGGTHHSPKTEDMTILHIVRPSETVLALVRDFEKSYITLVKDEPELISTLSENKLQLLGISKGKLIECIRKADDNIFTFALLLAIKQTTWYMCFFGINVAYLYLNKLCRRSNPMKIGLHTLHSSVEIEHKSVETDITRSHPSLAVLQEILHSKFSQGNSKALLLAEKVCWFSLKRLLMSMGLSYHEFNSIELGLLPISDCLIVSYEHISPSFPLENFSIIVEYGGPNASPRFSSLSNLDSFPCFHFIKVELDMSSACGQLSAGVTVPYSLSMRKGDEPETKTGWLEEVLNFVPLESVCSAGSSETTKESEFVSMPHDSVRKSGIIEQGVETSQRAVIVVNTQNVDKKMLISRRSTYQKVLAMEKEGVQVVERDSDLPVDIMLSPAICLLWYDCENASKKWAATIGASSSSLSWIEDIATNVLTSVSYSFSSCIMVFEGEPASLASVMDSSDGLSAAAATLGISLQIYCSSSADLTDEIVLRCIKSSLVSSQVHEKMPESESLAESFLTKFPSVNPLTAHVILSSSGSLQEFMKLPHSSKVERLQEYHVPEESIDLFSSLSKYGAREDSKSVMTDSSSSVSSGPDSDTHHFNAHYDSKRKQPITKENELDIDELVHFAPSVEFADAQLKPSRDFQLDDTWSSRDEELFHFDPISEFPDATPKPSRIINPNDSWPSQDLESFDKKSRPGPSSKDIFWEKDFGSEDNLPGFDPWKFPVTDEFMSPSRGNNLPVNLQDTRNTKSFISDYKGEVINTADRKFLDEDFPSSPGFKRYAPTVSDVDEDDLPRKSKFARKLSFNEHHQPNFPSAAELNSSSERKAAESNASFRGYAENFRAKRQKTLREKVLTRSSTVSPAELSFSEEISHLGRSPFRKAIHSENPVQGLVQGSPLTMEFLNSARERRRERSLHSYLTPSCLKTQGNLKKANTKRKSPSVLESFKYKGGNGSNSLQEEKRQKLSKESSASPKNERFYSPLKSWTPSDKRAKQTLSYKTGETRGQSQLFWK